MPISIKCTCERTIDVSDDMAGKQIGCPDCGRAILVPSGAGAEGLQLGDFPAEDFKLEAVQEENVCPKCDTPLADGAVVCTQCGWHLSQARFIETKQTVDGDEPSAVGGVLSGLALFVKGGLYRYRYHLTGGVALLLVATVVILWVAGQQRAIESRTSRPVGGTTAKAQLKPDRVQRQDRKPRHVAPEPPVPRDAQARSLYQEARSAYRDGKRAEATEKVQRVLNEYGDSAMVPAARNLLDRLRAEVEVPTTMPTELEPEAPAPAPVASPMTSPAAPPLPLSVADKQFRRVRDLLATGKPTEARRRLGVLAQEFKGTGVGWAAAELLKRLKR